MVMTALAAGHCFYNRRTWQQLGFRSDNLKASLFANAVLSLVIVLITFAIKRHETHRLDEFHAHFDFYLPYILLYSPAQEFLFRSYLFEEFRARGVISAPLLIGTTSLLYCLIHSISNTWDAVGLTLIMGLIWGTIYWRKPNFYGVALSHCVIGVVTILLGLI